MDTYHRSKKWGLVVSYYTQVYQIFVQKMRITKGRILRLLCGAHHGLWRWVGWKGHYLNKLSIKNHLESNVLYLFKKKVKLFNLLKIQFSPTMEIHGVRLTAFLIWIGSNWVWIQSWGKSGDGGWVGVCVGTWVGGFSPNKPKHISEPKTQMRQSALPYPWPAYQQKHLLTSEHEKLKKMLSAYNWPNFFNLVQKSPWANDPFSKLRNSKGVPCYSNSFTHLHMVISSPSLERQTWIAKAREKISSLVPFWITIPYPARHFAMSLLPPKLCLSQRHASIIEGRIHRPVLDGLHFNRIREEMVGWLEKEFSLEKIKLDMDSLVKNNTPDPDSFNFSFIKSCWETVGSDVMKVFKEFHTNGKIN